MNGLNMSDVTNYMLGSIQVSEVYYGSTKIWPSTPHDYSGDYFTIQSLENNNTISIHPLRNSDEVIEYSINNGAWQSVTLYGVYNDAAQTTIAQLNANDKLRIRHTGSIAELNHQAPPYEDSHNMQIYSTGTFNVYGNIMSLVNGSNFENTTLTEDFEFKALLSGGGTLTRGAKVVNASNLILPSNVTRYCYYAMFDYTTTLTSAPALPATTLVEHCYHEMFYGCSSLTTAPDLLASVLPDLCYFHMFYGCSSLNSIKCLATDISAYNCTEGWLVNVANSGTFTKATSMSNWTTGDNGIPSGWTVQNYGPAPHDYSQDYLTLKALEAGTFTWTDTVNNDSISYSTDNGSTWTTLASGSSTPTIAANSKVLLKANLGAGTFNGNGTISSSGNFDVMGNIMSMQDGDNFANSITINNINQFCKLFNNCTKLVDASNLILPATTLTERCYYWMFNNCTSLTTAPELPATTVYDRSYYGMFRNCSSLTVAPNLPATTIAGNCYCSMFQGCTSLTSASSILSSTTVYESCYANMFQNCTSLTTAPELPATILATRCYEQMFNGCSSLNYIKCLATNLSAYYATNNWVNGVAASGTFVKAASGPWGIGTSGIPSGWNVQNAS